MFCLYICLAEGVFSFTSRTSGGISAWGFHGIHSTRASDAVLLAVRKIFPAPQNFHQTCRPLRSNRIAVKASLFRQLLIGGGCRDEPFSDWYCVFQQTASRLTSGQIPGQKLVNPVALEIEYGSYHVLCQI